MTDSRNNGRKPEERSNNSSRLPPHNIGAEESILGAILLSGDALADVTDVELRAEDFYKPAHQHIFGAALQLAQAGKPVDTITVADELQRQGLLDAIGGIEQLHQLQNAVPSISNAGHYASIVEQASMQRRLILAASEITDIAYTDADNPLDRAEQRLFGLSRDQHTATVSAPSELLPGWIERLEERYASGGGVSGLRTGLHDLDEMIYGLRPGLLYVFGGRPGQGKTTLSLDIAVHVATVEKRPALVVSLEMPHDELMTKIVSNVGRINSTSLTSGKLTESDWAKVGTTISQLESLPLILDDDSTATVTKIRARARRAKAKYGDLGLIVVDYLQLVPVADQSRAENRQLQVDEVSRGLKLLARDLEVPVIATSQINRNVEARSDKRPMLADMRESGAIEAHADVVAGLYRDEIYDPQTPDRGVIEINLLKHRQGPTGLVKAVFLGHWNQIRPAAPASLR